MGKPEYLNDTEHRVLTDLRTKLEILLHNNNTSFKLVLFGSKARGDYDKDSDLDVAIIVDGMNQTLKNTIMDLVADIEFEYLQPISALVLSSQEFNHLLSRERRIAYDIEQEGILL